MLEYSASDSKNMIFTEDLKNMVHLVESTPEDLTLVMQMMKKWVVFTQRLFYSELKVFVVTPLKVPRDSHILHVQNVVTRTKKLEKFVSHGNESFAKWMATSKQTLRTFSSHRLILRNACDCTMQARFIAIAKFWKYILTINTDTHVINVLYHSHWLFLFPGLISKISISDLEVLCLALSSCGCFITLTIPRTLL